jgi:hypothetical protein
MRWQATRRDDLVTDRDQFAVLGLGYSSQVRESILGVDAEPFHQDPSACPITVRFSIARLRW